MTASSPPERVRRAVFKVRNIDCATCALGIEKQVRRLDGVKKVGAAIMLDQVFVDYDESRLGLSEIADAIKRAGYSNHVRIVSGPARRDERNDAKGG